MGLRRGLRQIALADYAWEIDNLRAALDWAFSPDGDGSIAVALTAAAPLQLPSYDQAQAEDTLYRQDQNADDHNLQRRGGGDGRIPCHWCEKMCAAGSSIPARTRTAPD